MKMGIRSRSISRSISARTTGRIKRSVKRSINPTYGKKGMGYINNPKKAVYNKIYSKTTVGIGDLTNSSSDLSSLTVAELKDILRECGLPLSGRKQDLIERLEYYMSMDDDDDPQVDLEKMTRNYKIYKFFAYFILIYTSVFCVFFCCIDGWDFVSICLTIFMTILFLSSLYSYKTLEGKIALAKFQQTTERIDNIE